MKADPLLSTETGDRGEEDPAPTAFDEMERGLRPISIGAARVRVVGVLNQAFVLAHVDSPFALFLLPDSTGAPALPTKAAIRRLLQEGKAQILPAINSQNGRATDAERMSIICDRLDAAKIPNGAKSIEIWLHANWPEDLARRYGDFGSAHTIRKWRARRRRGAG